MLELTAPAAYGSAPTRVEFNSDLGPVHMVYSPQATSHSIAQQQADSIASEAVSPLAKAGKVSDCNVGGEPGAAFGYTDGAMAGYRLYVVHNDYLYDVRLFGFGAVGSQAIQDAVGMIGSLTWLVPDAIQFTASNCSGTAATTAPRLLGRPYFTIRPAPNWTDTSGNYLHTETLVLELTAPPAYGSPPVKIAFHSLIGAVSMGYGSAATAHFVAQKQADFMLRELPQAATGTVRDCSVGGDAAAAFGYFDGTTSGYSVYVVHGDLLFEVILFGGVSNQAIQDSLGMIGSLTWAF
jgi:hypothetical protein